MSRFLNDRYKNMEVYVPGEQPKDKTYIKLNSNETSLPPSKRVIEAITNEEINKMGMYSDPHCISIREAIGKVYGLSLEQVFVGNGSDEVLGFIFMSFFNQASKICFPDITYYFYRVYAKTYGLNMFEIPLREDFTIDINDYINSDCHVIIANPNAPTGYKISIREIEEILKAKSDRLVIIDEAYVDYGNESCVPLIENYSNLIVVQTFSKSRNLAGARIGFALASKEIIEDLNRIKFTFNPYNLSSLTIVAGTAAILDTVYLKYCVNTIIETREYTIKRLEELGFIVLKSHTNFIFVKHPILYAKVYYKSLKEEGILTRYFDEDRVRDYLRITIGTRSEMEAVIKATVKILD
ncbi:MAG: histidinol-phosphate aminotransferase [Anaerocolumna sp.]|nr:histidinol-phosphate aminotransferase [Anaerocolumna sp.]